MIKARFYLMMVTLLLFNIVFKVIPNVTIAFFWLGFREFRRGGFSGWLHFVRVFPTITVKVYRTNYERVCREADERERHRQKND